MSMNKNPIVAYDSDMVERRCRWRWWRLCSTTQSRMAIDHIRRLPHPPRYRVGLWLPAWRRKRRGSDSQTCGRIHDWDSISHAGCYWGRVLNLHVYILVIRIWSIRIKSKGWWLNLMLHGRRLRWVAGIGWPIRRSRADGLNLFFGK